MPGWGGGWKTPLATFGIRIDGWPSFASTSTCEKAAVKPVTDELDEHDDEATGACSGGLLESAGCEPLWKLLTVNVNGLSVGLGRLFPMRLVEEVGMSMRGVGSEPGGNGPAEGRAASSAERGLFASSSRRRRVRGDVPLDGTAVDPEDEGDIDMAGGSDGRAVEGGGSGAAKRPVESVGWRGGVGAGGR